MQKVCIYEKKPDNRATQSPVANRQRVFEKQVVRSINFVFQKEKNQSILTLKMFCFWQKVNSIRRPILSISYVKESFGNRRLYWLKPKKFKRKNKKSQCPKILNRRSQSPNRFWVTSKFWILRSQQGLGVCKTSRIHEKRS